MCLVDLFCMLYHVTAVKGNTATVNVRARNHSIVIDEPVELLLSGVASCLTLTISIYAEAIGTKAENIEVQVDGVLDSAGMKESRKARPGFKYMKVTIHAKTDAEPDVFQQVIDLALLRCPVDDSVSKGVPFEEHEVYIEKI